LYTMYLRGRGAAGSIFTGLSVTLSVLALDPKLNHPLQQTKTCE